MDSHQWELSKENVMPLARGRDVQVLNEKLAPNVGTPAQHQGTGRSEEKARAAARAAFEHRIDIATSSRQPSESILAIWREYIKWSQDEHPAGDIATIKLLERCTKYFAHDAQVANDIRYLRIWILYADLASPDPSDIFAYMYSNQIGLDLALFYEAYAIVLEKKRQYAMADKLYQEGIARSAKPPERLENRHKEFQHRMALRVERQNEQKRLAAYAEPPASRNGTTALEELQRSAGRGSSTVNNSNARGTVASANHVRHAQSRTSVQPAVSGPRDGSAGGFQIFHDSAAASEVQIPQVHVKNPRAGFPAVSLSAKENSALPTKWNEGFEDAATTPNLSSRAGSGVRSGRVEPPPAASFQIYTDSTVPSSFSQGSGAGTGSVRNTSVLKVRTEEPEKIEVRLPEPSPARLSSSQKTPGDELVAEVSRMGLKSHSEQGDQLRPEAYPPGPVVETPKAENGHDCPDTRSQPPAPGVKNTPLARKLAFDVSEPTINTKEAMQEIEAMFSSPLPFEHAADDVTQDDLTWTAIPPQQAPQQLEREYQERQQANSARPPLPPSSARKALMEQPPHSQPFSHAGNPAVAGTFGAKPPLPFRNQQPCNNAPTMRAAEQAALPMETSSRSSSGNPSLVKTIDPQNEEVSYAVEEKITPWFAEQHAYKLIEGSPALLVGELVVMDRDDKPNSTYFVHRKLDEAASGDKASHALYAVEKVDDVMMMDVDASVDDHGTSGLASDASLRMKVVRGNSAWEFYVLSMLHNRMGSGSAKDAFSASMAQRFPRPEAHYDSESASYLLTSLSGEQCSLQFALDLYVQEQRHMPPALVAFYAIEMLRVADTLQRCSIIHTGLNLGSFIVRNQSISTREWGAWEPQERSGWWSKGLILDDFHRAIDVTLFDTSTRFKYARESHNWYFDRDAKALARIMDEMLEISCLGEGSDMDDEDDEEQVQLTEAIRQVIKGLERKQDNPADRPQIDYISMANRLESVLAAQTSKTRTLKNTLMRQNMMIYNARATENTTTTLFLPSRR
ncbi:putative inactive serine/threonine-protein kinase bub1 [Porphyridium purpureum]|uniref:Putative inactive serine/threonine-protein kinase bub1 n=1 Tax=Porphyridium purpureum TaxID=35688 RepID=A0A5J4YN13_PORPP|nr:putative inactive serine/threonine-protein kinase bub1 [Porphyridium purpureum]|eukprot:POR0747..scf222_8